ncbi:MAG: AMP-binding protein, partial [Sphingopyxis sp.]
MSERAPWIFGAASPDQTALLVADTGETLSFGDLNDRSARLANRLMADGLQTGDAVALLLENGPDLIVGIWAARRAGLLCIPLNWHLAPAEIEYILGDCVAKAIIASPRFTALVNGAAAVPARRYAAGTAEPGWLGLAEAIDEASPDRTAAEFGGGMMLYSSGTTGRPKGVVASGGQGRSLAELTSYEKLYRDFHEITAASVVLTAGPLYHAAPLNWAIGPQRLGATIIVFRQFDAAACLAALSDHDVSHVQMVPIHFVRLLKLPEQARQTVPSSALKRVVHAGAPCPVAVKAAMMDWWGPIIWEYYSGTEGFGMTAIDPHEWLAHPGSVGRPRYGGAIAIVGADG